LFREAGNAESACGVRENGDCEVNQHPERGGTFGVGELTGWSRDLRVTADADDVVAMVGVLGLRMLADRTGLTAGLSAVLARPGFFPVHDRGRVLTDVACSIAAGGVDLCDIEALRAQGKVFGPVASDTTALRALGEIGDVDLYRIDARRAAARAHLWSLLPDGVPASTYAGGVSMGATVVLRVDGTLTLAHSSKEQAEGTFKKTFGFHSLGVWVDNSGELAALMPRPGGAGSNTAADLIDVLRQAIAQIPTDRRDDLLITSDGAGASHALIDWLDSLGRVPGRRVAYSVGFDVDEYVRFPRPQTTNRSSTPVRQLKIHDLVLSRVRRAGQADSAIPAGYGTLAGQAARRPGVGSDAQLGSGHGD
jgi:DDE family transposase